MQVSELSRSLQHWQQAAAEHQAALEEERRKGEHLQALRAVGALRAMLGSGAASSLAWGLRCALAGAEEPLVGVRPPPWLPCPCLVRSLTPHASSCLLHAPTMLVPLP